MKRMGTANLTPKMKKRQLKTGKRNRASRKAPKEGEAEASNHQESLAYDPATTARKATQNHACPGELNAQGAVGRWQSEIHIFPLRRADGNTQHP